MYLIYLYYVIIGYTVVPAPNIGYLIFMTNMTQTVNRFLKKRRSMEATMPKPKSGFMKWKNPITNLSVAVFSSQTRVAEKKSRQHPLLPQRVQKSEEVKGSDVQAVGSVMTRTVAGWHKRHSSTSQVIFSNCWQDADRIFHFFNLAVVIVPIGKRPVDGTPKRLQPLWPQENTACL